MHARVRTSANPQSCSRVYLRVAVATWARTGRDTSRIHAAHRCKPQIRDAPQFSTLPMFWNIFRDSRARTGNVYLKTEVMKKYFYRWIVVEIHSRLVFLLRHRFDDSTRPLQSILNLIFILVPPFSTFEINNAAWSKSATVSHRERKSTLREN